MLHAITNGCLTVTVSEQGAELQSVRGADGTEYLWQGDPTYWSDRSPVLFPYVARLTKGQYVLDGQLHSMKIHGIAPYRRFALAEQSEQSLSLRLDADEDTRKSYPRDFSFTVTCELGAGQRGNELAIRYRVDNRDEKPMYFGLGAHPGFRVPLKDGIPFERYRLRFDHGVQPRRIGFTEACFLDGTDAPFPLEQGELPLRHSLFDEDAIVLKDAGHRVTLYSAEDGHAVTVAFPGMDYLGLWHMPNTDAPYICIEPWCSLPSAQDRVAVFEEQPDLICTPPGCSYENTVTILFR